MLYYLLICYFGFAVVFLLCGLLFGCFCYYLGVVGCCLGVGVVICAWGGWGFCCLFFVLSWLFFLVVCSCSCYLVCLLGDYGLGCYLYFGVGCGLGCYLFVVGCFGFGLLIGLIGLGCFELF